MERGRRTHLFSKNSEPLAFPDSWQVIPPRASACLRYARNNANEPAEAKKGATPLPNTTPQLVLARRSGYAASMDLELIGFLAVAALIGLIVIKLVLRTIKMVLKLSIFSALLLAAGAAWYVKTYGWPF